MICIVDGCVVKQHGLGYCARHWYRLKTYGNSDILLSGKGNIRNCMISECYTIHCMKGYCRFHYYNIEAPKQQQKDKEFMFNYFGKSCINCGISDIDVLNLDHINDDGYKDHGSSRRYAFMRNQIKSGISLKHKYQTLCANCNLKKRIFQLTLIRLEKLNIPPF